MVFCVVMFFYSPIVAVLMCALIASIYIYASARFMYFMKGFVPVLVPYCFGKICVCVFLHLLFYAVSVLLLHDVGMCNEKVKCPFVVFYFLFGVWVYKFNVRVVWFSVSLYW